jgi:ADP-heptose:LPS heptosyltransferase
MKILVLRFSSIGDIVLTTPVVRCLQQQIGAEVHFLTKKKFAGVLEGNPFITRIYSFEKNVADVLPQLKAEQYDYIIDLHHNWRSLHVKWALRRPARSFSKLNIEKWILVRTGIDLLPKRHLVERYMDTVRPLGVEYDGAGLDFFVAPRDVVALGDYWPDYSGQPFVAFAIGATHATKRLPVEKIVEICQKTSESVLLLGGPAEAAAGQAIAAACPGHVLDLCGRLTLGQSASVVQQATRVFTHDTGLMHIAAAFQKKMVSYWGSTVPAFGMWPFYANGANRNTTREVSGLPCRPCSKIGHVRCPKGHFRCMWEQQTP